MCERDGCDAPVVSAQPAARFCSRACQRKNKRKRLYWKDPERFRAETLAWAQANPEKVAEGSKKYWAELPDEKRTAVAQRTRAKHLRRSYGLTIEQYEDMYAAQGGQCAICGREQDVLAVDHNHTTGRVRKLLCRPCNLAIGLMADDAETVFRAARYLVAA